MSAALDAILPAFFTHAGAGKGADAGADAGVGVGAETGTGTEMDDVEVGVNAGVGAGVGGGALSSSASSAAKLAALPQPYNETESLISICGGARRWTGAGTGAGTGTGTCTGTGAGAGAGASIPSIGLSADVVAFIRRYVVPVSALSPEQVDSIYTIYYILYTT
jgi:hypothetical protein